MEDALRKVSTWFSGCAIGIIADKAELTEKKPTLALKTM